MTNLRNHRKRTLLGSALGALLLLSTSLASAVEVPTMTVQIGGETVQSTASLSWTFNQQEDRYTLANPATFMHSSGSTFTIGNAYAIVDPVLFFSASATNNTANPLTYSFAFNTPLIPPLLGLVDSHAELGVTITDGFNDGATVQPALPGGKMLTSFDLYSNGTPISKNVDIGNLFSIVSGTGGTSFSADNQLVCSQACVTMSSILSFTLTGQDSVGFSGKVVQNPVPLPAAAWLFGSGLIGLAGVLRKKFGSA